MTAGMLRVARKTTTADRTGELPDLARPLCEWMLSMPHPEVVSLLECSDPKLCSRQGSPRAAAPFAPLSTDSGTGDRERLMRAAARLAAENGHAGLTEPKVRSEAGVPRRRFQAQFKSLDDCFLDSIELIADEAVAAAHASSMAGIDWERRTCETVLSLCVGASRNRSLAQVVFVEILAPGRIGLLRREHLISRAAVSLRDTIPPKQRPLLLALEASVAAAWHIVRADIAAGRTRDLAALAPLLSYILLAPVIGAKAAAMTIQREFAARVVS